MSSRPTTRLTAAASTSTVASCQRLDPIPGGTLIDWQDNFAVILGNEASSEGLWEGTFRLAAVHRRALTQEQITQNFDAGVGERFYMLFDVSERIGAPIDTSFVLFEAQQFDNFAYLFDKPHFITLDGVARDGVTIKGLHLAMNGQEVKIGQSYANMDQSTDSTLNVELGQPLSVLGAVIPLEKGPEDDQFFLTFDDIDGTLFRPSRRPDAGDRASGSAGCVRNRSTHVRRNRRDLLRRYSTLTD